jgi:xylulokinase
LWNQIKANVCNRPVLTLVNEETGLLGDAIIAGVAVGIFKSIDSGCETMVAVKEIIKPDLQAEAYVQPYQLYCELDRQLVGYFKKSYAKG